MSLRALERSVGALLEGEGFRRVRAFTWVREVGVLGHWVRFEAQSGSRLPVWCVYDTVASPRLWGASPKHEGDTSLGVPLWSVERGRFSMAGTPTVEETAGVLETTSGALSSLEGLVSRAQVVRYLLDDRHFVPVLDLPAGCGYDFVMPHSLRLRRFAAGLVAGADGDAQTALPLLEEHRAEVTGSRFKSSKLRLQAIKDTLAELGVEGS